MSPRALITGVAGQDGRYLSDLLLAEGYDVYGLVLGTEPAEALDPLRDRLTLLTGDLLDDDSLAAALRASRPVEVYNLAAQSSVGVSWDRPVLTAEVDAVGVLRLLEAVRTLAPEARVFQPSSADMFGRVEVSPQDETTPLAPVSPYATSKLFGHLVARNYRDAYGMHVSTGIMYNHESPLRPPTFVTRKITAAVARIARGLQQELELGDLDACRDWGFAGDYVRAMTLMVRHERPDEFVIASGEAHTVREFCETAFARAGLDYADHVRVDPALFRPADPAVLVGDPGKARRVLGWEPRVSFRDLVEMMVDADLARLEDEEG